MKAFFGGLGPLDHLAFTAGETLQLGPLAETEIAAAHNFSVFAIGAPLWPPNPVAAISGRVARSSLLRVSRARPHAGWSLGASICAAMEGLTRALAMELAPTRVNIVSPGVVKSPLWANMADRRS